MTRAECLREADVLEAVSLDRWPDRVDADLSAHVSACPLCTDLVAVVSAFEDERDVLRAPAPLPAAGLVWWRAQLRARQEAARVAVRPITVAQAVGFAGGVGVAGAVVGATVPWVRQAIGWVTDTMNAALASGLPTPPAGLVNLLTEHALVAATGGVLVLLAPLAIYVLVRLSERQT